MFDLLFGVSIVGTVVQAIKDSCTPAIPDENFDSELYYKDIVDGVPLEKCQEKIKNGAYRKNNE